MTLNPQGGPEKFGTIGSRLGDQGKALKEKLFSKEDIVQQESGGSISAAQASAIKEGAGVGVTIQKQGKESWFQAGSEKAPASVAQYDRPGKKEETNEELVERLARERKEREEREKELRQGAKEVAAVVSSFFQMPERKPEKKEPAAVENLKEVHESAARFQESAAEKKKILEDLKKETDTEKRKELWGKKNYITLEHQRNWAAFAYENAKNDGQKKKAEEDFLSAKKMLDEYVSDPIAYEKKNNWEYSAPPASSAVEKTEPKTENIKKEVSTEIKQPEIDLDNITEEPNLSTSVAEELERNFGKTPAETKTKEATAGEEESSVEKMSTLEDEIKRTEQEISAEKQSGGSVSEKLKELESKLFTLTDNLRSLRLAKEAEKEEIAEKTQTQTTEAQRIYAEKEGGSKYVKKMGEQTPEELEKIKKLKESLENQEKQIEKDAEEKGYLDTIRKIGENYKKARLTYKGALALAILAGVSSGGAAALLGASVGIAMRIGGGAAAFVGVEALLEKKRQEKERWWNKNPKIMAALSAGIMSGAIGKMASATGADEWLSHVWGKAFGGAEVAQSALERAHGEIIPPPAASVLSPDVKMALEQAHETILPPEAPLGAVEIAKAASVVATEAAHTVVSGENLHNIIGGMKELSELEGGRRENAIANIIAHLQKNPAEYGIASGDVNRLAIGDHINMEKIHSVIAETKIGGEGIVEHAKHLADETITKAEVPPSKEGFMSNLDKLDKTISEIRESQVKTSALMSEFYNIGQSSALDLSDTGIANLSANEGLPSVIERNLENVFGVGEKELGDTEWTKLQSEDAEDFLDDFSLDTDSPEEKLREYLGEIIDDTKISPDKEETILEYLNRVGKTKI